MASLLCACSSVKRQLVPTINTIYYSVYEKEILRIVTSRARESGDSRLGSFVEGMLKRRQYLKLDDLRGEMLRKFGKEYGEKLDARVKGAEASYTAIIASRDSGAHGGPICVTIDQLEVYHLDARRVLAALSDILCRSRDET